MEVGKTRLAAGGGFVKKSLVLSRPELARDNGRGDRPRAPHASADDLRERHDGG
jgi:hypothetical protein